MLRIAVTLFLLKSVWTFVDNVDPASVTSPWLINRYNVPQSTNTALYATRPHNQNVYVAVLQNTVFYPRLLPQQKPKLTPGVRIMDGVLKPNQPSNGGNIIIIPSQRFRPLSLYPILSRPPYQGNLVNGQQSNNIISTNPTMNIKPDNQQGVSTTYKILDNHATVTTIKPVVVNEDENNHVDDHYDIDVRSESVD